MGNQRRQDRYADGPRVQPIARTGAADLFNQDPAKRAEAQERELAAWLRRSLVACCEGCRGQVAWTGIWEDRPQCPHCHHVPDLDQLRAMDVDFRARSRVLPSFPCDTCSKQMAFVKRQANGVEGPVDVKANVYVILLPGRPGGALGEKVIFEAWTGKDLAESGAVLHLPDGRQIPMSDLMLAVSHFATCPSAAFHSKKGRVRPHAS